MARNSLKNVCRLIEAAKTTQPVEKSFVADLKRSMELSEYAHKHKASQTYKPSSMKCIRNMWYQVTGTEADDTQPNACLIGICNSGTDIHERTQTYVELMKENGIDCEYVNVADYVKSRRLDYLEIKGIQGHETKLYHKDLNMSFLCDGIIKYQGRYYILEIKSESMYKWQTRTGVNPEHYNQGIAYSVAFGIDEVIFLYINRDNTDMKAYLYIVTSDMKQNLIGLIEECDSYVAKLTCPPKPEDVTKKTCEYCNYRERCRGNG